MVVGGSTLGLQLESASEVGQRALVLLQLEVNRPASEMTVERIRVVGHAAFRDLDRLVRPAGIEILSAEVVYRPRTAGNGRIRKLAKRILPQHERTGKRAKAVMRLVEEEREGEERECDDGAAGQAGKRNGEQHGPARRPQIAPVEYKRLLEADRRELREKQDPWKQQAEPRDAGKAVPAQEKVRTEQAVSQETRHCEQRYHRRP